jgi:chromosomal replication initiator protein
MWKKSGTLCVMEASEMGCELSDLWRKALSEIEKQISRPSFETWIKTAKPIDFDDLTVVIEVPNEFAKDWLEARYYVLIKSSMEAVTNKEVNLAFVAAGSGKQPSKHGMSSAKDVCPTCLDSGYIFDTFIVGNCNRIAHSAALAVAQSPARSYNPLFLHGGAGLGKTHLIQAIGNYVLKDNPDLKVCYVSSEKFINELINSIRDDNIKKFQDKYRKTDMLIIDDIHFLAGKERTQEELFHTFNALYETKKQIILSSAKSPKQITPLEETLCSRFEGGLLVNIQPPDIETRTAILSKKVEFENLQVPNDVITYIAGKFHTNIREVEGAFARVVFYSSAKKSQITIELAREALEESFD